MMSIGSGALRVAIVVLVSAALCACGGWRLRGTGTAGLQIQSAYITERGTQRLATAVRTELTRSGVKMTKDKSTADVVVDLQNEEFDRRVLSVDPDTGKVREVEIGLQVRFSVRTGGGELIHPSETLNWEQDFVFDENSVLGTVEQETRLRVNLAQDAARTIMVKLETLKLPTP